jgi:hypothetical protein
VVCELAPTPITKKPQYIFCAAKPREHPARERRPWESDTL